MEYGLAHTILKFLGYFLLSYIVWHLLLAAAPACTAAPILTLLEGPGLASSDLRSLLPEHHFFTLMKQMNRVFCILVFQEPCSLPPWPLHAALSYSVCFALGSGVEGRTVYSSRECVELSTH